MYKNCGYWQWWPDQTQIKMNEQIVYDFAEAINRQNIEKIYSLMSNDHTFIDAQGNKVGGKT